MTVAPYVIMDSKQITKCCFCIPLRTACLIIAYLTLAYTTFVVISLSGIFSWLFILSDGFYSFAPGDPNSTKYYPELGTQQILLAHYAAILMFFILLHVFSITLNILCLIGIHKRRPDFIHWHISFATARTLVIIASLSYNILMESNLFILFAQLIDIGVTVYCIRIFYVYIGQLKRELADEKANKEKSVYKIPIA